MKNKDKRLNQTFFIKTGLMGLLVLLVLIGATPLGAHQVIEGTIFKCRLCDRSYISLF